MMINPAEVNNRMKELYQWLSSEIEKNSADLECRACGSCCNYQQFGHRIYVTTPEIMYLKNALSSGNITLPSIQKKAGICPFLTDGSCGVRDYRFGPCRIFYCRSDGIWQNELSERFLSRIRTLCDETSIDYRYIDIASALDEVLE